MKPELKDAHTSSCGAQEVPLISILGYDLPVLVSTHRPTISILSHHETGQASYWNHENTCHTSSDIGQPTALPPGST